ncbi:hypothetical protein E2P81_ATG11190 [Venturia nashicola]|nr:hypothetical protein E2P81_ATG11190 [Venturia nashicola]
MRNTSPLRLQLEADKLNQLDSEFSSAIFEEVDGFGIIKAILSQYKQEPTMTDSIDRSPLHVALERPHNSTKLSASHDRVQRIVLTRDDCQIVETLLNWGVPIGTRDMFGRTALHLACFYNWSLDVIQLLIEASDRDIDAKDVVGNTAFLWAVKKSNMELAKLLLATEKVDVNTRDKIGCTPLYFAVTASNQAMVRMLLARDDIAPSADERGELSPLTCAFGKWNMEIIMLLTLWRGYDINDNCFSPYHSTDWRSLLSLAATHGKIHAVEFLLAVEGIDVNTKSLSGMTALDWARKKGHEEVVALLTHHELYQKPLTRENMVVVIEDDESENSDDHIIVSNKE